MPTLRLNPRAAAGFNLLATRRDGTLLSLSGAGPWSVTDEEARIVENARVLSSSGFARPATDDNDFAVYGHSLAAGQGVLATERFGSLLADYHGVQEYNFAVGGSTMVGDGWWQMYANHVAGRATVLFEGINDVTAGGTNPSAVEAYKQAMRAAVAYSRFASFKENTDASVTYPTGTWAPNTPGPGISHGNSNHQLFTATGSLQVVTGAVAAGSEVCLYFVGNPPTYQLKVSFTVDGQAATPTIDMTSASHPSSLFFPFVARFQNLGAGSHTIVANINSNTGAFFDFWSLSQPTPPTCVLVNVENLVSPQTNPTASIALHNAALSSVANEFGCTIMDAQGALGSDTTLFQSDGIHANAAGHRKLFNAAAAVF